jgi:hypothetical protein
MSERVPGGFRHVRRRGADVPASPTAVDTRIGSARGRVFDLRSRADRTRAFYAAWRSELASNLGFYVGAGDENRTRTISLGI